jgi:hypothetical protein
MAYTRTTPFVNEGPDPRLGGVIGEAGARLQRASLIYSTTPTKTASVEIGKGGHAAICWPPYVSIFLPKKNGRFWSFRAGYRNDPNIGDGNNPKEPIHDPPGGKFLDVIVKTDIDHVVQP